MFSTSISNDKCLKKQHTEAVNRTWPQRVTGGKDTSEAGEQPRAPLRPDKATQYNVSVVLKIPL